MHLDRSTVLTSKQFRVLMNPAEPDPRFSPEGRAKAAAAVAAAATAAAAGDRRGRSDVPQIALPDRVKNRRLRASIDTGL